MRYRLPDVKIYLSQWANTVGIKYASLKINTGVIF
jgi:hypothetical protein